MKTQTHKNQDTHAHHKLLSSSTTAADHDDGPQLSTHTHTQQQPQTTYTQDKKYGYNSLRHQRQQQPCIIGVRVYEVPPDTTDTNTATVGTATTGKASGNNNHNKKYNNANRISNCDNDR